MELSLLDSDAPQAIDRRTLLARAGVGGAGLLMGGLLAGCGGNNDHKGGSSSSSDFSDLDVLNFALNLEYLEASYYTIGVGEFLLNEGADTDGTGTAGTATGGRTNTNLGSFQQYFREIAFDESSHVRALRSAIRRRGGTPVARPEIDLGAVNAAIRLAITTATGSPNTTFDAFSDGPSFLLGGFLLSDVGATAYVGGSQYLNAAAVKLTAAQILAVEGYHVGSLRTLIAQTGGDVAAISGYISTARDTVDAGPDNDQGAGAGSDPQDGNFPNIAPTFPAGSRAPSFLPTSGNVADGLAFPRTIDQVLAVVYNNSNVNAKGGGLFPAGVNANQDKERLKTVRAFPPAA